MTRERIEELARLLLPDPKAKIDGIPAEVDALARALNDPAYGWTIIKSFLDSGEPLPRYITEAVLVRPYHYVREGNGDEDVRQALALEHAANKQRQILLRCLLLRPEFDHAAIGKRVGASEAAILIYENLFWNMRDRLDDPLYIPCLVYPQGRQVEFEPDYSRKEDPMYLALRATVNYGIEAAEELLGLRAPDAKTSVERQGRVLAARILSMANFAAKLGFLHQDLPIFRLAARVLKALGSSGIGASRPSPEANITLKVTEAFQHLRHSLNGNRTLYPTQMVARRMNTEPAVAPQEEVTGVLKRAA